MDIIFRLIEFLISTMLHSRDRQKAAAPRTQPSTQAPAPRSQTSAPAMAPRTASRVQDPIDDGEFLRSVLTVLALIVLVIMAAVWFVYTQGWLPGA